MNAFGTVTATALLAAAATLANAQTQSPMPPISCLQKREAMKEALTPTAFATTAVQEGMTEVALSGLALRKSHNDQVKQFALGMLADHAQVNRELEFIVKCKGLILPTQLDSKYEAILRSLNEKSGTAFDRAYVEITLNDHAQALTLFESASKSSDPDVAAFARKTLTTLQEHNQLADNLRVSFGIRAASAR